MKVTAFKSWRVTPRWMFLKIKTNESIGGLGAPVLEGLGVEIDDTVVIERSKQVVDWRTPTWRHHDGAVAER